MDDGPSGVMYALMFIVFCGVVVGSCAAYPQWKVYSARLDGEAASAQADGNRKILITQAKAEHEAAVERAKAIEVVGAAAQKYPEYRTQEFIGAFAEALKEGKMNQVIYVPTEANIPIIEARAHAK